ncbi:MAG TPA: hypothetical protein VHA15_08035 [Burkholderiales bacterium]|jgi:hypothetical protein|nr:hypothetical protein [Burkholderiales bacterium]
MKGGAWLAGLLLAVPAAAHDLVTAEAAQGYLARQQQLRQAASQGSGQARAAASVELGQMLDGIRDLFNRDIEAHGKVQGLPSNFLMGELRARGDALAWSASRNRFTANLAYYREALRLPHDEATHAEASFRLLQGGFWDAFSEDPLQPEGLAAGQIGEQIRLGEDYLRRHPHHSGNEEARFIVAIHYMQAALAASGGARAGYARKARALAGDYRASHPDSLRTATLLALLERLPP